MGKEGGESEKSAIGIENIDNRIPKLEGERRWEKDGTIKDAGDQGILNRNVHPAGERFGARSITGTIGRWTAVATGIIPNRSGLFVPETQAQGPIINIPHLRPLGDG
ncbi:MAG: hypothetical protein UY41_C0019G0002 [Candidatus Moranbacteria bacterium GW2011_GWE1_49_15]|nr:MAG: hypothetical protein UX75_C0018G0010 [Candidatus Moranbacteria bacterium GW2011_GWE2_47_10]KKW06614.1 MAG: hypothetical protein UY41_C0019G0002 [Candidatus Moranbacteria bacterium GW2011_GWE1_49_15]HBP01048.1 hypothetical protein [Candidatus Moranbacteria bacterium]